MTACANFSAHLHELGVDFTDLYSEKRDEILKKTFEARARCEGYKPSQIPSKLKRILEEKAISSMTKTFESFDHDVRHSGNRLQLKLRKKIDKRNEAIVLSYLLGLI